MIFLENMAPRYLELRGLASLLEAEVFEYLELRGSASLIWPESRAEERAMSTAEIFGAEDADGERVKLSS